MLLAIKMGWNLGYDLCYDFHTHSHSPTPFVGMQS